jgi:hypothetical protein
MNRKSAIKWGALFLILLFPSTLYLVLSTGKHNLFDLPYYAPAQQVPEQYVFPFSYDARDQIKVLAFLKDGDTEYSSRVLLQLQAMEKKLTIPELRFVLYFEGERPEEKELNSLFSSERVRYFEFRAKSFENMTFQLEDGALEPGRWVLLVDKQNQIRGVYPGQEYAKIKELGEDVKALKAQEFVPKKEK